MQYTRLVLLSLPICAAVLLGGCGTSTMSSSNSSGSGGAIPTVVATGEQNNGVAPNRSQYVQFNEPMDASTINNQTLIVADSSGRPAPGAVTYNADLEIAGFKPNPALAANTAYTLTVTTGVASAQGVHMAAPYTSKFTTRASTDTSPIYVKSVTPAPNASCVSATTPIVITFNEGADVSTLTSGNIVITGPSGGVIPAKMGYSASTATVTLTPNAPLPSGSIMVKVSNVADAAGVMMTSAYGWSFSTTCGGGGSTTTQYIATILGAQSTTGQVTIDTAGNTTVQLNGATPNSTYTVQFCPASAPEVQPNPAPCFDVTKLSTDAGGNATSTAKFPKSGEWAGDFDVNDSTGKLQYQTYLAPGVSNQTFLATLLPESTVNGGLVNTVTGPQDPLQSGTVSYSNGEIQVTMKGTSPNTAFDITASETVFLNGSGTYVLQKFTTDAQGDASAKATFSSSGSPGGDQFQVVPATGNNNGFYGGFKVP